MPIIAGAVVGDNFNAIRAGWQRSPIDVLNGVQGSNTRYQAITNNATLDFRFAYTLRKLLYGSWQANVRAWGGPKGHWVIYRKYIRNKRTLQRLGLPEDYERMLGEKYWGSLANYLDADPEKEFVNKNHVSTLTGEAVGGPKYHFWDVPLRTRHFITQDARSAFGLTIPRPEGMAGIDQKSFYIEYSVPLLIPGNRVWEVRLIDQTNQRDSLLDMIYTLNYEPDEASLANPILPPAGINDRKIVRREHKMSIHRIQESRFNEGLIQFYIVIGKLNNTWN